MIVEAIKKVVENENLSRPEAVEVMNQIMSGGATDAQIAALITGLRMKGETVDEISGFAEVMRAKAVAITPKAGGLVDTCGTGGDLSHTFNISTTAAFVTAAAGVPVAKHGNRSVSSACGSADLLEALGVKIDVSPQTVADAIDEVGIGFLFAPALHQAMKYAIGPRKEIGIRTIFNILGPLTNPARAPFQVLGVYDPGLTEVVAEVLAALGTKHALVVHGAGLDEMTTTGTTRVSELSDGRIKTYDLNAQDLGLPPARPEQLTGGSIEANVAMTRSVLDGQAGAPRDIVLLNAAGALLAAERVGDLETGLEAAAKAIDSRRAAEVLAALAAFTTSR
jgi:anthranilate phosphoribosyltransferase